ncbi:hypothetical protein [Mesobacillus zeae]|uniref:VCBS repeat-containing protein n=1 Tax=Mesobacillus zeae TaxID=1917180 RepID=A0A398B746_9BACI|nr:hypothetical protein [Mesobacillus zeae]RID85775.1 hypothetical protein D1970_09580 [Mesobacillus zeae]
MRKSLLFAISSIVLLSLFAISSVNAVSALEEPKIFVKKKADVTGDNKKDTILLKGVSFEENSAYLKAVLLETITSHGQKLTIKLPGGYDPELTLKDLNHDGIKDMFVGIPTGGSGGLSNYFLYTMKYGVASNLTVPDPLQVTSQFEDGYKASITLDQTGKTYTFDLSSRKADYERLGLYQDGKLNEPTELMVQPYGLLEPVKLESGEYGLKGIQRVSGAYQADAIASVVSHWVYKDGKWVLSKTYVKKTGTQKERKGIFHWRSKEK